VSTGVLINSVRLAAAPDVMEALRRFYVDRLGLADGSGDGDRLVLTAGPARVEFVPAAGGERPFYHFALLAPGNRYAAARAWLERCAELLSRPGQTSTTFRFDAWDADACYFHDPAGNIVELIAHRGCGGAPDGAFTAAELRGISELGMVVTDPPAAAEALASAGLELWSGSVEGAGALAFIGRQAHTLILCPPGRPWLPTQRPAEAHPVTATVAGGGDRVTVSVSDGALSVAAGR
jgi:catechol 2,3-dioxygenase-like lactoylglutathione lyase family enzyme